MIKQHGFSTPMERKLQYFLRWCEYRKLNYILWGVVIILVGALWELWTLGKDYEIQTQLIEARYECELDKIWYDRVLKEAEKPIKPVSVKDLINEYADNPKLVLKIATCESQLGKYRENWEGSGAEGLLMFKPQTWNAYCEGDIKSDVDQIKCFNQLYPKHPSWWECRG